MDPKPVPSFRTLELFVTPIYTARCPEVDLPAIRQAVLREVAQYSGKAPSSGVGPTSGAPLPMEGPVRQLARLFVDVCQGDRIGPPTKVVQVSARAIILRSSDPSTVVRGHHLPWSYTGIFYPDVGRRRPGDGGNIILFDPRPQLHAGNTESIAPADALLAVFAGSQMHAFELVRDGTPDIPVVVMNAAAIPLG